MSEPEAASIKADLEALEALQADAPELERIEDLLDRFNVFETIGFTDQELMHSRFLAFLLNPRQSHALDDFFLKRLLKEALSSDDKGSLGALYENLDQMDLRQTLVRREHEHIDILLTNEAHEFAVIIENKTWTTEHDNQLSIYHQIVKHTYPGWLVFGIYLTPQGVAPLYKEDRKTYLPCGYEAVCRVVEGILEDRGLTLDLDLMTSMKHYVRMVRRKLLGDPEIIRLSQQIYQKHKRAFDLIYEHRPKVQEQIRDIVENLIDQHPSLEPDLSRKDNIKFVVGRWDDAPVLKTAEDYTPSGRILIFEVWNDPGSLNLNLFIGPGPEATRQGLLRMVHANPEVFRMPSSLGSKWLLIFKRPLLKQEAYEDHGQEEREQEIRRRWDAFLKEDLPRINTALDGEPWIWEPVEPDEGRSSQGSRFVWGENDIVITKRPEDED